MSANSFIKREFEINKAHKEMVSKTQGILTGPNLSMGPKERLKTLDVAVSRTQSPGLTKRLRGGFLVEASKSSEHFGLPSQNPTVKSKKKVIWSIVPRL